MKHCEFDKDRHVTEVNYLAAPAWLNPVASMFHNLCSHRYDLRIKKSDFRRPGRVGACPDMHSHP